jgi:hypothetical protein
MKNPFQSHYYPTQPILIPIFHVSLRQVGSSSTFDVRYCRKIVIYCTINILASLLHFVQVSRSNEWRQSNMQSFIFQAHSGWRWIVILVAVVALVKLLIGWLMGARWSRLDQGLGAALPIVLDIQLLLGLVLWIVEQRWNGGDPLRSFEHPVTMILAIVAAHITWSRVKKSDVDQVKYRTAVIGFAIALILVVLGVLRVTGRV